MTADQPVTLETALDASRKANERYNALRGQLEAMGHIPGGGELDLDRLTFLKERADLVSDFQDAVMARAVATAALDAVKDEHTATVTEEVRPKIELAVARLLKSLLAVERANGQLQEVVNRASERGAFGTSAWSARPTLTFGPCHGSESRLHLWKRHLQSERWLKT